MAINDFFKENKPFDDLLNTLVNNHMYTLLKQEEDANNTTVTAKLIELLTHWFDRSDGKLPEKLALQKDFIAELAKKREERVEILMIEALERGVDLILSHDKDHLPMSFPL